jgi:hypothetical protein
MTSFCVPANDIVLVSPISDTFLDVVARQNALRPGTHPIISLEPASLKEGDVIKKEAATPNLREKESESHFSFLFG